MATKIFFIAVVPNEEIQNEVIEFKNFIAANFNSKKALTSPPHITIIPPFKWEEYEIKRIQSAIEGFTKSQTTFSLELKNFNCFSPRVIYVDIVESMALNVMQADFQTMMTEKFRIEDRNAHRGFHPHMTIGFKDLKKTMFFSAWKHFKKQTYRRTFDINQVILLKHNGKNWEHFEAFPFGR